MGTNSPTTLARARELARSERRQLTAEISAFERFGRRVRALTLDEQSPDGRLVHHRPGRVGTQSAESVQVREISRAYRQTVLAVGHWQEAYGESTVEESMSAEFSVTLANLLVRPGAVSFTQVVQTRLIAECEQSATVRRETRRALDAELDELDRLRRGLPCVAALTEAVRDRRVPFEERVDRIRRARRALERLLDTHQTYLHSQPHHRYDVLVTAVYADLDVHRYPGLSTIACLLGRVQELEVRLWTR